MATAEARTMTATDVHEAVKAALGPEFLNETVPGTMRWKRAPYQAALRTSPGTREKAAAVELTLREFGRKDRKLELGLNEKSVVEKLTKAIKNHLAGPRDLT